MFLFAMQRRDSLYLMTATQTSKSNYSFFTVIVAAKLWAIATQCNKVRTPVNQVKSSIVIDLYDIQRSPLFHFLHSK